MPFGLSWMHCLVKLRPWLSIARGDTRGRAQSPSHCIDSTAFTPNTDNSHKLTRQSFA
ncbi:hypothetical protein R16034_04307 [Ralstonia edaphis]|uniref:Uncharacterized protein n=1 Tax=Ralstonia edaphi TaxID=3058599 RepID=A0AB72X5J1_9RALS|nr:hypothetical protein R16034_04307 [Ralstonia sp. LMG 6871]